MRMRHDSWHPASISSPSASCGAAKIRAWKCCLYWHQRIDVERAAVQDGGRNRGGGGDATDAKSKGRTPAEEETCTLKSEGWEGHGIVDELNSPRPRLRQTCWVWCREDTSCLYMVCNLMWSRCEWATRQRSRGGALNTSSHRTAAHTHTRRQIMCKVLGLEQEITTKCTMMDDEHGPVSAML